MPVDGTHPAIFLVEVLGVLVIPGPTNSLLFVSGVSRGFQASLTLIVAEVGAYFISISMLLLALAPIISLYPILSQLLRIICSIYLLHIAIELWRSGGGTVTSSDPITVRRVFLTTLVNPKNLILAFGIFPIPQGSPGEIFPYLSVFSLVCTGTACGWIAAGSLLHSSIAQKRHLHWFYRGEAFLLAGFAIMIFASAYH